jgi:hypothetical protein
MEIGNRETKMTVRGVYNIKGIRNTSCATIVPTGLVEMDVTDSVMDKQLDSFSMLNNVQVDVYLCNILDTFLMTTKKLPLLYATVYLEKPMRRIYLYKIYVYFTITSNITKSDDLINNKLDGVFSTEVSIDNKSTELNKIATFNGMKQTLASLTEFIKSADMTEMTKSLVDAENERLRKEFCSQYQNCEIPKATVSLKNYVANDDSL